MLLKNLKLFFTHNKLLFILLLITQAIAITVILLCYGAYLDNSYSISRMSQIMYYVNINFSPDASGETIVKMADIKEAFPEVLTDFEEGLERVYMISEAQLDNKFTEEDIETAKHNQFSINKSEDYINTDSVRVTTLFTLKNGKYTMDKVSDNWKNQSIEGDWFTEDDMNTGNLKCLIPEDFYKLRPYEKYWSFSGLTYECIGHASNDKTKGKDSGGFVGTIVVPLESLSDTMNPSTITILFDTPILHSKYNQLVSVFTEKFGDGIYFDDFASIDIDTKMTLRTMMMVSVLMSVISAFTVCLIYKCILHERMPMTAIYQICGSTSLHAALIYIKEVLSILTVTTFIGSAFFFLIIEPKLENSFTWFNDIFANRLTILLPLLYLLIVSTITIISITLEVRKPPKEILNQIF